MLPIIIKILLTVVFDKNVNNEPLPDFLLILFAFSLCDFRYDSLFRLDFCT